MHATDTARASITADNGWTATVTHAGTTWDDGRRHVWRWTITDPSDPAGWTYNGDDLSSPAWNDDPDPVDMLETFGSFLAAYAEAIEHTERTGQPSDNADLFPASLPAEAAAELADAIALATSCPHCHQPHAFHAADCPITRTCDECGALPGETCFPFCTAPDSTHDNA